MIFKIGFTLTQVKGTKVNAMGDAVVQATLIILQFFFHPTGGTTACNEYDVIAILYPIGPEIFQFSNKVTTLSIHPWHLIEEQHQILFQEQKSLVPIIQYRYLLIARKTYQSFTEVL